ncbi:hypothetical protein SNE26_28055 [Mucilaginibacter sp. cycad4]|uniref:hypothetical protein n=1 Tax=Mucilaginibacter sp. cycad4 TaxID=3342096 RepID=UPI002AABE074|nr:hypothetical protein [Mucilaginibacter gossypii]WPU99866.1 hypothetical protein SNE26_28055 [Mucilaginibacter gossypii]
MKETFVKKFWEEEKTLFYLHFQDNTAVRQIEVNSNGKVFLSEEYPVKGDSILYDQTLQDLDLQENDFISEQEFEEVWSNR